MDAWELAGTIERAQDRRDEKWIAAIELLLSRVDEDELTARGFWDLLKERAGIE